MNNMHTKPEGTILFLAMSVALIIINIIGFGPTFFFASLRETNNLNALKVIHGIIFSSWYLLLLAQALLIDRQSLRLHKYLGYCGAAIALAVIVNGAIMAAYFANDFQPTEDIGALIYKATGVWANFHLVISFTTFVLLGLTFRKKPDWHKRFMLMSAIAMMTAAVTRIANFGIIPIHAGALTFIGMLGLLLTPILYEYIKYRNVHAIYKWGTVAYFITLIIFAAVMPFTPFGQSAVFWFK